MPFDFKAPESRTRGENPADMLLRTFKTGRIKLILGVTLPKYNGEVVDAPGCAKNLTVQRIAACSEGFECIPENVVHEFSWEMELPPDPPWTSQQELATEIQRVCAFLDSSPAKGLSGAADFTQCTRLTVRPKPNWPAVREQIYSHEMQHVCDFRWAAMQLFGPVVQMQDDYYATNERVHCADRAILEFVAAGGNECNGIAKYEAATKTMGAHYHGTMSGGPPVLTFAGISVNGREAYIDLQVPYAFPLSFHTGRPHQYFKVTAGGLRNEVEGAKPPARDTPEFTQEVIDQLMSGGGGNEDDDSGGEQEFTW